MNTLNEIKSFNLALLSLTLDIDFLQCKKWENKRKSIEETKINFMLCFRNP